VKTASAKDIMADIFQEVEEDLRRDRYERLAKAYGGHVIAGVLLLVAGTAGYVLWKDRHEASQQAATLQLAQAVDQAGLSGHAPVAGGAGALDTIASGGPSGAAGLARFFQAGLKAGSNDRAAAITLYEGLAGDPSVAPLYQQLATLMAVQLQINDGDPAALTARLDPLGAQTSPWRFTARELRALLAARTGDTAGARTLFQQLADDNGAPAGLRVRAAELAAFYGKS
jgi:hypothetical protein